MSNASEQQKDSWFFTEGKNQNRSLIKRGDSNSDLRSRERADVVIGSKSFISGTLQLDGLCIVDGTIEGEVASTGELIIGEPGVMKARLSGNIIRVYGRVVGDIDCQERLELKTGAVVTGNISARGLVIEDGVVFQGYCTMVQQTSTSGLSIEIERSTHHTSEDVLELTSSIASDVSTVEASVETGAEGGSESVAGTKA